MLPDPVKKYLKTGLTALVLLLYGAAQAQIRNGYQITLADGLPSNNVYSAYRDHLGYLWLCTEMGLVRYNGYSFDCYNMADGLPSPEVFEVYEDRWNRLWINVISDRIGYVRNNRYHEAHVPEKLRTDVKPTGFIMIGASGVWRLMSRIRDTGPSISVFYEVDDTFHYTGTSFQDAFWNQGHLLVFRDQIIHSAAQNVSAVCYRYNAGGVTRLGGSHFLITCLPVFFPGNVS